jgi:H+/Na+-translocating ferredoxin:NAD+ oxidoreductase subunit B
MSVSFIIALGLIIIFTLIIGLLVLNQEPNAIQQPFLQDIDTIEKLLPQTQCGDCGFNGCRPYAEAIANHVTDINRCLPGGIETVKALSLTTSMAIKPLYKKTDKYKAPRLALIEEEHCIGCVKCIAACPVDAILGAPKQMHSIINSYCTGCELCIAPCPVDCISMVAIQ